MILHDEDGNEVKLPTKWEVCSHCRGEGKSSAYLGVFTGEDMANDPEFYEDYIAGRYDKVCPECDGRTTVKVVDESRLTKEQKHLWLAHVEDERHYQHLCEMERRMGA